MMTPIIFELRSFIKNQRAIIAAISVMNIMAAPLVLPYAFELQRQQFPTGVPFIALVAGQIITGLFVYVPVAAIGLFMADRIGLGAPLLQGLLLKKSIPANAGRIMLYALCIGALGGIGIVLFLFFSKPYMLAEYEHHGFKFPEMAHQGALQGFLASVSAGITEETLFRLGLLSFLVWFGMKVSGHATNKILTPVVVFWFANVISSLVFGALHLPLAASMMALTPPIIANTLVLNGFVGIIFGWVYKKYGLEGAMTAHFSTDVVLKVIYPLFST